MEQNPSQLTIASIEGSDCIRVADSSSDRLTRISLSDLPEFALKGVRKTFGTN